MRKRVDIIMGEVIFIIIAILFLILFIAGRIASTLERTRIGKERMARQDARTKTLRDQIDNPDKHEDW